MAFTLVLGFVFTFVLVFVGELAVAFLLSMAFFVSSAAAGVGLGSRVGVCVGFNACLCWRLVVVVIDSVYNWLSVRVGIRSDAATTGLCACLARVGADAIRDVDAGDGACARVAFVFLRLCQFRFGCLQKLQWCCLCCSTGRFLFDKCCCWRVVVLCLRWCLDRNWRQGH